MRTLDEIRDEIQPLNNLTVHVYKKKYVCMIARTKCYCPANGTRRIHVIKGNMNRACIGSYRVRITFLLDKELNLRR